MPVVIWNNFIEYNNSLNYMVFTLNKPKQTFGMAGVARKYFSIVLEGCVSRTGTFGIFINEAIDMHCVFFSIRKWTV